MVRDANINLVLAVNHHDPHMRGCGLAHIAAMLRHTDDQSDEDNKMDEDGRVSDGHLLDPSFVTSTLLTRLCDDDPSVVCEVLKLGPTLLVQHCGKELLQPVTRLMSRKKLTKGCEEW